MTTRWILRTPQGKCYGNAYQKRCQAMYLLAHTRHDWRAMHSAGWRVVKVELIEVEP